MASPKQPLVETISKRSPFGSLLSRTLPKYKGLHPVGVCDIEIPVPNRSVGTFKHKKLSTTPAGLALETALFSVFYPAENVASKQRVVWFPNLQQTVDGFVRMAGKSPNIAYKSVAYPVAAAAIYGTTFPAIPNAPLETGSKWPLMIFSHGVGCSRLMYSSFCGEMASRGYVVCAIEHRDGTSPCSTIVIDGGKKHNIEWLKWNDLLWPDLQEQPTDDTTLRHVQIEFRLAEIFHVVEGMLRLSKGESLKTTSIHGPDFDWRRWTTIDAENIIMAGHSLGGSVALAAAVDSKFKFRSIISFDPALQRLEPWTSTISTQLLIIGSDEWINSDDHPRLEHLAKFAERKDIFSIARSTHPSFSDVFLILPTFINRMIGLKTSPELIMDLCTETVLDFLLGAIENRRKMAESSKDLIYHS